MSLITKFAFSVLTLLYPFAIYFGASHFSVRYLVLLLAMVALLRVFGFSTLKGPALIAWLCVIATLAILSLWTNTDLGLQLYPVAINMSLLVMFVSSLWQDQTVVERLARLQEPNLNPSAVLYTRTVTKVWSGFFLLNGSMAAFTVWWGNRELWLLYNGFIAYVMIGLLGLGEWIVRRRVKSRHQSSAVG